MQKLPLAEVTDSHLTVFLVLDSFFFSGLSLRGGGYVAHISVSITPRLAMNINGKLFASAQMEMV